MHKFRDGNIVSLKLENFQTFRSQSFCFGPCLNMIAAPNGMGKSSIANAIALLFGGNAKTIGKTKEISEYIRFGSEQAIIEAEVCIEGKIMLFKRCISIRYNNGSGNTKISKNQIDDTSDRTGININDNTSTFNTNTLNTNRNGDKINRESSKTQYFIDNNLVSGLEYMRFLKKYRIETDNLSVFLPQEKVGAFCNMGPKELMNELLRNSEISLDKYYKLQNERKEIEKACETNFSTKQLMEGNLKKMEDVLEEYKKTSDLEKRKFFLECKQTYMRYDELCEEYLQIKNTLKTQEESMAEFQKQIKENEEEKNKMVKNKTVSDYETMCMKMKNENSKIREIVDELCENTRKCTDLSVDRTSIERKESEWEEKKMILENKMKEEKKRMRQCKLDIVAGFRNGVRKISKFYEKMADMTKEKRGQEWEMFSKKLRMAEDLSLELSIYEDADSIKGNSISTGNKRGSNDRNEEKINKTSINYSLDNNKIMDLQNKFEKLIPNITEYDAGVRETEEAIRNIKTICVGLQIEVDKLESEKLRHGEHKEKRLFQLQNYHQDTYKAVCWLRKNASAFREEILEPAYLHIEVDEEFRSEVENLLSFQSLSSFLVRNEEDLSKLSNTLKDNFKFWVNIAEVVPCDTNKASENKCGGLLNSVIKKKYCISGMASEFIKGRSEYIDFINRYSHLDHIPISKTDVKENELFNEVPVLKRLVANNVYIEIRRSRYDKSWVINRSRLKESNIFRVPKIDIVYVEQRLAAVKTQREEHCRTMEKLLSKKVEHEKKAEDFRKEFSFVDVGRCLYLYAETRNKYIQLEKALCQQDLKEEKACLIENEKKNNEEYDMLVNQLEMLLDPKNLPNINVEEAEGLIGQIMNYENNIAFARHAMEAHTQAIDECNTKMGVIKGEIKILKAAIRLCCENEYLIEAKIKAEGKTNVDGSCLEIKDSNNGISQLLNTQNTLTNTNNKLSQPVSLLNLLKSKLTELPDSVNEILNEISFINSKLEVMQNRRGIKTEYDEKEKALSLLSQSIAQLEVQKQSLEASLESEKKLITKLLGNLINPITAKFGEFFKRFGCRGELEWKLEDGDWILLIMVSFRDSELLTRLCAERQSGGEKSLATVLFLLALQQSTSVGFRLVDEINQGMDATNERIVFELLSEMSLERQFFIITPKLVDKLVFSKSTRAIILYGENGMTKALEKYTNALIG